jgi:hypothetical protein
MSRLTSNAANALSVERRARLDTYIAAVRDTTRQRQIVVTSTERTSWDQARIMFDNYSRDRAGQFALYGPNGQAVLRSFDASRGLPREERIRRGAAVIDRLSAEGKTVSRHLTNYQRSNELMVFDIGYDGIANKTALIQYFRNLGATVIDEPQNRCIHVEMNEQTIINTNTAYLRRRQSNNLNPGTANPTASRNATQPKSNKMQIG